MMHSNWDQSEGGDGQQQQPQSPQPPQQAQITASDLDVEVAQGAVLRSVQERHGLNIPSTTATAGSWVGATQHQGPNVATSPNMTVTSTGEVQTKICRIEAAVRAQQAASGHASHMLHDMILEEETGVGIYQYHSPRSRGRVHGADGLMKAAAAVHHGAISKSNPYGSHYDHHFLRGQDTNFTSVDEGEHRLGLFRRNSARISPNSHAEGSSRAGTPLSMQDDPSGHFASGYVATTKDGFVHPDPGYTRNSMYATGRSHYYNPSSWQPSNGNHKKKFKIPRLVREILALCHPYRVFNNCHDILVRSHFLWVGVPCLLGSAICYYLLDNPSLHALPGETTIAVWLLFATRQTVTLGLARLAVFILVDGLMLGTHLAVQTLGPLITLSAATGNGWPLYLTTWGLFNFVLIHGDSQFQMNWLYWTEVALFNQNFGGELCASVLYTRILLAAVLGGLFVSAKRTIFALRFGRKQVAQFKPRLKRILADVVLLDEIATLAEQADKVENKQDIEGAESDSWDMMKMSPSIVQQNINDLLWVPKIEYQNSNTSDNDDNESAGSVDDENTAAGNTPTEKRTTFAESPEKHSAGRASRHALRRSDSGRLKIKDMLDYWEAPDANSDKASDISIHEILKFRRALAHLEEENIFGDAFGSTANRDECIANSHSVYYRLLKLAQETDQSDANDGRISAGVLPFDVLALLCLGQDGMTENLNKKRKIRKLFIPDKSGELPLVAFIQAVDQCYKRLVFLRASLRNASLLDGVLEKLFNAIFYFTLTLFLSSILQLHPWALMVSITSILVSVSFAFGSSVSAYVDGVLLIAIRRPFDLGDRIFISSADSSALTDVTKNSWFVEDITLATTTLRFARTNEVCTVNNSSIASTRIVNLARSPNATVHFEFAAHISILDDSKLDLFRKEIQKFVDERPRTWQELAHIRHDMFDAGDERVDVTMALRHRNAWQEAGRIKNDRVDIFRFLYKLGNKLDIHFSAPVEQRVIYQGGVLKRGDTDDGMARDILNGSNIRPYGSDILQPLNPSNIGRVR